MRAVAAYRRGPRAVTRHDLERRTGVDLPRPSSRGGGERMAVCRLATGFRRAAACALAGLFGWSVTTPMVGCTALGFGIGALHDVDAGKGGPERLVTVRRTAHHALAHRRP